MSIPTARPRINIFRGVLFFSAAPHRAHVKGNNFTTLAGVEAGNDNFDKAVRLYTAARDCYSEIFDDEKVAGMDKCLQDVEDARREHTKEQEDRALLAQRQACEQALANADLLLASAQQCAGENRYGAALDHGESALSSLQSVRSTPGYESACDAKIAEVDGLCKAWRERLELQETARAAVNAAMADAQLSFVAREYQKAIDCLKDVSLFVSQACDEATRDQYDAFHQQLIDVEKNQKQDSTAVNEARMIWVVVLRLFPCTSMRRPLMISPRRMPFSKGP